MSSFALALEDHAASAPDDAPDPSVLRAERRLRLLEELADIGMDLARGLRPCALPESAGAQSGASEVPATPAPVRDTRRDPADAFGPLSRAIRLTLALEARTDAELRDLKAGVFKARADERAKSAERAAEARQERTNRVFDLISEVAEAQIEDDETFEEVCNEVEERLSEHEAELGAPEWPLRETVEGLCKAFGLRPDWSRWNGEDWGVDHGPMRPFVPRSSQAVAWLARAAPSFSSATSPSHIESGLAAPADPPPPTVRLEGVHDLQ
ncbi:MAG TPA: hypothetical protein VII63_07980 [Caulobacteraceae bacterium]